MKRSEKFKETLQGIESKVTGDNADEVKTNLKQLAGLFEDVVASLTAFGDENKEKRSTITSLERKVRDVEEERDTLKKQLEESKNSDEVEGLKKQIETLETEQKAWLEHQRKTFAGQFSQVVKHPNFEKTKDFFSELEPDKDGKYDFDKLDDDTVKQYAEKMAELNKLEYFGPVQKKTVHGNNQPEPPGEPKPVEDRTDLTKRVAEGLNAY